MDRHIRWYHYTIWLVLPLLVACQTLEVRIERPTAQPVGSLTPGRPELSLTSPQIQGDSVREVQRRLTVLGYDPGQIDGIYGPRTTDAVRQFQADHGLDSDGIVGEKTWSALLDPNTAPAPPAETPSPINNR